MKMKNGWVVAAGAVIVLVGVLVLAAGGGRETVSEAESGGKPWVYIGNDTRWTVIEYNGHEYIIMDGYSSGGITPVVE